MGTLGRNELIIILQQLRNFKIFLSLVSIFLPKLTLSLLVTRCAGHNTDLASNSNITARKMKFFIKDFLSKCDEIHSFLQIWSHLLNKFLMENFIFCASISKTVRVNIDLTVHFFKEYSMSFLMVFQLIDFAPVTV